MIKHKVITRHISDIRCEAGQRSHIVTAYVKETKKRGDLNFFAFGSRAVGGQDSYGMMSSFIESCKRGKAVWSRDGWSYNLTGKTLTCTKTG